MKARVVFNESKNVYELLDQEGQFIDLANGFLAANMVRGLSSDTIRAYAYDLQSFFSWLKSASKELKEICESDLLTFVSYQRSLELSPKTINRRLTAIRVFYRFCFSDELPSSPQSLSSNSYYRGPGKDRNLGIHNRKRQSSLKLRVKEARKLVKPLGIDEVKVFIRSISKYRDLALVYLMLFSGLRSIEVRRLKWCDLDILTMRMRIHGKGNKERMLPLNEVLKEVLEKYRQIEHPKKTSSEYVFSILQGSNRGKQMKASSIRGVFRYNRMKSGVPNANPHRFRHTFGSELARQKLDVLHIQKLMGHEHLNTSLQYIQLSIEDLTKEYQEAMQKIQSRYGTI